MLVLGLHIKDRKSTRDKANLINPKPHLNPGGGGGGGTCYVDLTRDVPLPMVTFCPHHFSDWWLRHILWNCPNMNVTGLHWWSVNIASGNGLVPSDNKPLPEQMLTQISVAIWCHFGTMSGPRCPVITHYALRTTIRNIHQQWYIYLTIKGTS